jgi:hypothetical protein
MSLDCGSARRQTADQSGLQPAVFEGDSFDPRMRIQHRTGSRSQFQFIATSR